jgi:hypothetical protein
LRWFCESRRETIHPFNHFISHACHGGNTPNHEVEPSGAQGIIPPSNMHAYIHTYIHTYIRSAGKRTQHGMESSTIRPTPPSSPRAHQSVPTYLPLRSTRTSHAHLTYVGWIRSSLVTPLQEGESCRPDKLLISPHSCHQPPSSARRAWASGRIHVQLLNTCWSRTGPLPHVPQPSVRGMPTHGHLGLWSWPGRQSRGFIGSRGGTKPPCHCRRGGVLMS